MAVKFKIVDENQPGWCQIKWQTILFRIKKRSRQLVASTKSYSQTKWYGIFGPHGIISFLSVIFAKAKLFHIYFLYFLFSFMLTCLKGMRRMDARQCSTHLHKRRKN